MSKSVKKPVEKFDSYEEYEEDFEDYAFDFADEEADNNVSQDNIDRLSSINHWLSFRKLS